MNKPVKTINITETKQYWTELDKALSARARITVEVPNGIVITYSPANDGSYVVTTTDDPNYKGIEEVSRVREELLCHIEDWEDDVIAHYELPWITATKQSTYFLCPNGHYLKWDNSKRKLPEILSYKEVAEELNEMLKRGEAIEVTDSAIERAFSKCTPEESDQFMLFVVWELLR